MTRAEVGIFFRDLAPLLRDVPIRTNSVWMGTGAFLEGGSAPTARHGDIRKLTAELCSWARNGIPESGARTTDTGSGTDPGLACLPSQIGSVFRMAAGARMGADLSRLTGNAALAPQASLI